MEATAGVRIPKVFLTTISCRETPRRGQYSSPMDESLMEILCCPVTRQSLRLADAETLRRAGAKVSIPLAEGLLREDGQMIYPVKNGIPLLVPEEGIAL